MSDVADKPLSGKTIVIAGARKSDELSAIIGKQGGIPLVRPLQGTIVLADRELDAELRRFVDDGADWLVLTTGMGLDALVERADQLGVRQAFMERMHAAKIAARGYKTFAALKRLGFAPDAVDEDGTVSGLIRALAGYDFAGRRVVMQLHGVLMPAFVRHLENRGAAVRQLLPYKHIPPERRVTELLCEEISGSQVDAVCFTTEVQVRYFFAYAEEHGHERTIAAFRHRVVAVAVGKVTAGALKEAGIERLVMPESERMGAMIVELARYYAAGGDRR